MTDPTPEQPTEPIDSTRLREEVRKKVDAWIAAQPEPRPSRAEAIERQIARHFKDEIGDEENARRAAECRLAQVKVLAHRTAGKRDIHAVDIGDEIAEH